MTYYGQQNPGRRRLMVGAAALVVLVGGFYAVRGMFGGEEQGPDAFSVPVETYRVEPQRLQVVLDSVGTLVANESVVIRPEVSGRITDIPFIEGQPLKKGDKLFQIDDRMARAELKQAQANLQLAQLNHGRFQKLAATGAATKSVFDQARATYSVAQANVDLAKTKVDYAAITAPFDGTVGLRKVSPGDYVDVGQELANFVSYDPMKVDFTIPETQAAQLKVGQDIAITVEAVPGEIFYGTVYALDPQLDVQGRAMSLRARIPNPEYKLKPGYFARVELTVAEKPDALMIPESAIVPQGNDKFVYKVGEDDAVAMVPVTLGERRAGQVEITSGLQAGDEVVTSGQIKLHPGATISRLEAKPQEAAPVESAPAPAPAPVEEAPVAEEVPAGEPVPPSEEDIEQPADVQPADEGAQEVAP